MRKIIVFILVALSLAACEKDYHQVTDSTVLENVVKNNKVSLKQALLYAENSVNGISPTTRSAERKVKSTEIYVAKPATRSAESTEVSFYLINYEDNEGFAMVSTDSRATPVYAYSDEGNLTAEDFDTNPFLEIFIEGSIENYQIEVASYDDREPIDLPDSIYGDIRDLPIVEYKGGLYYRGLYTKTINKNELLTTYWHQNAPYGNSCPGKVAGCGPIAAAQIMAYHKHPTQHYGHTYNWDAMTATTTLSAETIGAISAAELIYDIGFAAGINYPDETGVNIYHLRNTFGFFNYNCAELPDLNVSSNYDIDRVVENINDELPVLISGYPASGVGHAWVIDGCRHQSTSEVYFNVNTFAIFETNVINSSTYFHCNLGWGPSHIDQTYNNGYYYSNSFLYNNDLMVVYDITPIN